MAVMREIARRARPMLSPLLMALVASYFGYHAVQGERGLIAWWQVTQQIREAKAAYARVHAERETLERRVGLLKPESIDPDLLDERARAMLGLARPDELVILLPRSETDVRPSARVAPSPEPR